MHCSHPCTPCLFKINYSFDNYNECLYKHSPIITYNNDIMFLSHSIIVVVGVSYHL